MSTITTRAGKGSPLTNNEVDANFTNLNTDKAELSGATFTGDVTSTGFSGDITGAVLFQAKAGEAFTKGDPVYISGISGNTTVVSKADANDANKMPCFGIVNATVSINANCSVVTFGTLSNLNTSAFSEGDELYISDTGTLSSTAPTGETSQLQKIAKVTRAHASAGSIKVMGAGRTNATPNLNDGKFFLGNSSNQSASATFSTSVTDIALPLSGGAMTGAITTNSTFDGRDVATDGTKLDGIEASADVTDTANVTSAGALMDSELTSIASVKALNQGVATTDSPTFAGLATSADVSFGDNDKATFGAGDDLQIYHNGSDSFVSDVGTGDLYLQGSSNIYFRKGNGGEVFAHFADDGACKLRFDNSTKLATTSTGIDVTGTAVMDGLSVESSATNTNTAFVKNTAGTGVNYGLEIAAGTNATDHALHVTSSSGASLLRVNGSGNVGIGTGSPSGYYSGADNLVVHQASGEGGITVSTASNTSGALYFADGTSGDSEYRGGIAYNHSTDVLSLVSGGAAKATIDSAGNVEVKGGQELRVYRGDNATYGSMKYLTGSGGLQFNDQNNDGISFVRGGSTESARIDSSSNLLLGQSSTTIPGIGNTTAGVSIRGTDGSFFSRSLGSGDTNNVVSINRSTADGSILGFYRAGVSVGIIGTVAGRLGIGTGDAGLFFDDDNNKISPVTMASGTPVDSDGLLDLGYSAARFKDLYLSATANTAHVNVGGGTVADPTVTIDSASGGDPTLVFNTGATNRSAIIKFKDQGAVSGFINYHHQYDRMDFGSGSSTGIGMSLKGGNLMVGTTAVNGVNGTTISSNGNITLNTSTTNGGEYITFRINGTQVGSITTSGGNATSYNTSSDYRLKEDWQPMSGATDRLKELKPVNFAWKTDGSRVDGFLAHELQEVVPEAVTGEKDAMQTEEYEVTPAVTDEEGNVTTEAVMGEREVPDYQGIDQSKLVPLLVATIQELEARISQLENN